MPTPPQPPLLELAPTEAPIDDLVALPHAPMLTYVTASNSAPRVRAVTTWGVRAAALLEILLALWFNRGFFAALYNIAMLRSTAASAQLSRALSNSAITLLLAVILLALALFQFLLAAAAGRGKRSACFTLIPSLLPLILLLIGLAASTGASAIDDFNHFDHPLALLSFFPASAAAVAALLTKDLATFLRWAALNPYTDKPPTAFLSLRPDASLLTPPPPAAPDPSLGLPAEPPPTRVRTDTAIAFACLSWLSIAAAISSALWIAYRSADSLPFWWWSGLSWNNRLDILLALFLREPLATFLLIVTPPVALISRILVRPIRRGSTAASILAILFLLPPLVLPLLSGAFFAAIIIGNSVGWLYGTRIYPAELLYLLLLLPLIVWSTLLTSLMNNLFWIARNPDLEKPPARFFRLRRS
jgi:hypothetical protein